MWKRCICLKRGLIDEIDPHAFITVVEVWPLQQRYFRH